MIVIYSYSNMIFALFGPAICDEEQHSQDLKKAGWMTPVDQPCDSLIRACLMGKALVKKTMEKNYV